MSTVEPAYTWPRADFTRIPYGAYHDQSLYEREQDRVFRGPTWNYLALEAEIPQPGDFKTVYVGETAVVVSRAGDGALHAFVNRCAHRGSVVCREEFGNATRHTCIYHRWTYDATGQLTGVPFRDGVDGRGGLPKDFEVADHRLRPLHVQSYRGVIFGTFREDTEPLLEFLDQPVTKHLDRLMHKPLRILGYQRQVIHGNWKLYTDNVRDPNHGGLLHPFQVRFGIARLTQWGGASLDQRARHNISYVAEGTDSQDGAAKAYEGTSTAFREDYGLADDRIIELRHEYGDPITLSIMSVFPNVVFHQIGNSLATRQIRPRGVDAFEIYWTYYGYEDDDQEMTDHRLRQANMAGPGGLISMEDGEAIELVHRATRQDTHAHSMPEYGGRGPAESQNTLVTEAPLRGFWAYYCEIMGIETQVLAEDLADGPGWLKEPGFERCRDPRRDRASARGLRPLH